MGTALATFPTVSRLDRLRESSMHFQREGPVFGALNNITKRLDGLGIPYAVVGGMALFFHGFERYTTDVDLLVTPENLKLIHEKLEGLGYLPPFAGSKQLKDTQLGVKVEFLVTGQFPGDGKPKPLPFPDPVDVAIEIDGVKVVRLTTLIDLKLASGMTNTGRINDLGDVQRLIETLDLPLDLSEKVSPYVREKYLELWHGLHDNFNPHADG